KYYYGFVPVIISMIFPLIVFIAVIFFTSRLAARSEIIAILANGINFHRMMRPYLMGGVALAIILWLGNQYVIPRANGIRSDFQVNYIDRNSSYQPGGSSNTYHLRADSNTYFGLKYYDTSSKAASQFFLEKIH